jgi:hypothetical protein
LNVVADAQPRIAFIDLAYAVEIRDVRLGELGQPVEKR